MAFFCAFEQHGIFQAIVGDDLESAPARSRQVNVKMSYCAFVRTFACLEQHGQGTAGAAPSTAARGPHEPVLDSKLGAPHLTARDHCAG